MHSQGVLLIHSYRMRDGLPYHQCTIGISWHSWHRLLAADLKKTVELLYIVSLVAAVGFDQHVKW